MCIFGRGKSTSFVHKLYKLWNLSNFLKLSEYFCDCVVASYTSKQETVLGAGNLMNGFKTFINNESL